MLQVETSASEQVERILQSDTFRASGALRRLFRYLADKAFAGEADQLKEYTIGLDAFGKPSTYDPREDAIVRLQIGRLRQKLGEYYRTEGKEDTVLFDLPKGHFRLKWEMRPAAPVLPTGSDSVAPQESIAPPVRRWQRTTIGLSLAVLLLTCWSAYAAALLWRAGQNQPAVDSWTPAIRELWGPFIASSRPVVIAIPDPLFIGLEGTDVFFRKISLRRPEDAASSPEVSALRKVLGNPPIQASFNFTPTGELYSSFLVGKLLGTRRQDISLARSSQVPLQRLTENNIILIGPEIVFDQKLPAIQLKPQLEQAPGGIRNLHPRSGEPAFFADAQASADPNDGEVYALVSHASGPLGNTVIQSFTSTRTWGREGAVQAFSDPALARTLADKLRNRSGAIPRSYQLLLKVKFTEGIPTQISYVMHRDLTLN